MHRQVIEDLERRGQGVFSRLREAAVAARDAVLARDLDAFGRAMIANTEAQRALHPELVGVDARRVIEIAAAEGAVGWKINGAGGDGGSITILSNTQEAKQALEALRRRVGRPLPHASGPSQLGRAPGPRCPRRPGTRSCSLTPVPASDAADVEVHDSGARRSHDCHRSQARSQQ